jgi:O-antigen/teichoic acid export membrane protein
MEMASPAEVADADDLDRARSEAAAVLSDGSLSRRSVRGGIVIILSRGAADGVRLLSMLVLARLLTPAEFGIVAMVFAVVGIAEVLQDLGLSSASVQRAELTERQASTLFWMNVAFGAVCTAATFLLAPAVAQLVGDPSAVGLARLLAPMFVISAMSSQHLAMMSRRLQFGRIARIRVAKATVYAAVSIGLAVGGFGGSSLVWAILLSTLVETAIAVLVSPMRIVRPRFDRSIAEITRLGVSLSGFSLLSYLAANVQTVAIGRVDGAAATGFYGRAQRLVSLSTGYLITPIDGVAFPVLSRLADDERRWADYYRTATALIGIAVWAVAPFLVVHADLLVAVLLGDRWAEVAPVVAILGAAFVAQGLCYPTGWIFRSRGEGGRMLRWGTFGWTVVLIGTVAGVPFGIEGVATGYAAAVAVLVWPCLWYAFRGTPLRVGSVVRQFLGPVGPAVLAATVSALVVRLSTTAPALGRLALAAMVHLAVYGLCLLARPQQRTVLELVATQIRRRERTSAA